MRVVIRSEDSQARQLLGGCLTVLCLMMTQQLSQLQDHPFCCDCSVQAGTFNMSELQLLRYNYQVISCWIQALLLGLQYNSTPTGQMVPTRVACINKPCGMILMQNICR